jgi:hypothetical protein
VTTAEMVAEAKAIREQFTSYMLQHLAKDTDEGRQKAAVNLHWASRANQLAEAIAKDLAR